MIYIISALYVLLDSNAIYWLSVPVSVLIGIYACINWSTLDRTE